MKTKKHIQHGDLSLHFLIELPLNLKEVEAGDTFILAEGEATGHCHRLKGQFKLFTDEAGNYYVENNKAVIEHWDRNTNGIAEHHTKPLTKKFYVVKRERSYNPFTEELNRVSD